MKEKKEEKIKKKWRRKKKEKPKKNGRKSGKSKNIKFHNSLPLLEKSAKNHEKL